MQRLRNAPPELLRFTSKLLPACAAILKDPGVSSFSELRSCLESFSWQEYGDHVEDIVQFVAFPLVTIIKSRRNLSDSAKIQLLECVKAVTASAPLRNSVCFIDMFTCLNSLFDAQDETVLNHKSPIRINPSLSEEAVKCLVLSLRGLLLQSLTFHGNDLLGSKVIGAVGHCIYMQLFVVATDLPLDTRLCSLDIIQAFFDAARGDASSSQELFRFFPGMATALCKACSVRGGRVRQIFATRACDVLSDCIEVCLRAQSLEQLKIVDNNLCSPFQTVCHELSAHQDDEIRKTAMRLCINLVPLFKEKQMIQCGNIAWQATLVLSCDTCDSIYLETENFLCGNTGGSDFCEFELVIGWIKESKEKFASGDQEESLRSLQLVCGSFICRRFLNIEISAMLPLLVGFWTDVLIKYGKEYEETSKGLHLKNNPFSVTVNRLAKYLLNAVPFDVILEEFVNFISYSSALSFEERCDVHYIGGVSLFAIILQTFCSAPELKSVSEPDLSNLTQFFIDVLHFIERERKKIRSPSILHILEIEESVLVEALYTLTTADIQYLLPSTLYCFIEYAGKSEQSNVCLAAKLALHNLAPQNDVKSFLSANLDLVLMELSARISSITSNPQASDAVLYLAEFFNFGRPEFVKLVQQVLMQSCDDFYTTMQATFAKMLFAFVYSIRMHVVELEKNMSEKFVKNDSSLETRLLKYQFSMGLQAEFESTIPETPLSPEALDDIDSSANDEKTLSPELNLVLQICERALNFLPLCDYKDVQVTSIESLTLGVYLLQDYENHLLPLAHQIWSNLAPRFATNDYLVMQKSFQLLVALCKTSRYFLKKRVVEQIFPKLSRLMTDLSKSGEKVNATTELYYTFTQEYKLQTAILEGLSDLVLAVDVSEEDLDKVIECCCHYITPFQHKKLQDAARKLLVNFAKSPKAEVFWFKLIAKGIIPVPDYCSDVPPGFTPFPELTNS